MDKIEQLFQEIHKTHVVESDHFSIAILLERLQHFYYVNKPDIYDDNLPGFKVEVKPMKRGTPQRRLTMMF